MNSKLLFHSFAVIVPLLCLVWETSGETHTGILGCIVEYIVSMYCLGCRPLQWSYFISCLQLLLLTIEPCSYPILYFDVLLLYLFWLSIPTVILLYILLLTIEPCSYPILYFDVPFLYLFWLSIPAVILHILVYHHCILFRILDYLYPLKLA